MNAGSVIDYVHSWDSICTQMRSNDGWTKRVLQIIDTRRIEFYQNILEDAMTRL